MESSPLSAIDRSIASGRALAPRSADLVAALAVSDPDRARAVVRDALAGGVGAAQLYVDVIRPAVAHVARGPVLTARLAADIGLTVLADALDSEPLPAELATGRAALVTDAGGTMQAMDGDAIAAFLSWSGWQVARSGSAPAAAPSDLDRGGAIELAVVVVDSEAPVAALEPICTSLRRVADPPVILLADLTGVSTHRASLLALGVDDVVCDPDALLRIVSSHSPGPGRRRWGVRLLRSGETFTVAPTGTLDAVSVDRLADIAGTRAGSFRRLVIDLRDLSEIEPSGIQGLLDWPARVPCGEIARELLIDGAVRRALDRTAVAGWALTERPG